MLKRSGWSRKDAVDLLERQPCQCFGQGGLPADYEHAKVVCIRCELLVKLGADPMAKP